MIKDLVNAVASEKSLIRSIGVSGIHFTVEVHLTRSVIEEMKCTAYLNIEEPLTFMGCPLIEDSTNFVCTVHKTNLVDKERL